ncbi:MAG: hypothetical protein SO023_03025 [Eubacterium sp.]|nr:hypothetical protein [Eubacterium sp.]
MRKKMKSTAHYIVGFLVCALIVSSMSCTDVFAAKKISLSSKKIVLKEGGRKTIKVKNSNKRPESVKLSYFLQELLRIDVIHCFTPYQGTQFLFVV